MISIILSSFARESIFGCLEWGKSFGGRGTSEDRGVCLVDDFSGVLNAARDDLIGVGSKREWRSDGEQEGMVGGSECSKPERNI